MAHQDDREAALAVEPGDRVHDRDRRPGVDARRGLVEEEEPGLGGEGSCDQDALLLSSRERPEGLLGDGLQPDLRQALGGEAVLVPAGRLERTKARERAHEDDLEHGEGKDRVEGLPLRDVARRARAPVEAVLDAPGEDGEEPEHPAEKGGLAGTVRAEEGAELARLDLEGDALQDRAAVVAEGHVVEGQRRRGHQLP